MTLPSEENPWPWNRPFLLRLVFLYMVFYIYPYGFEYIYSLEQQLDSLFIWPQLTLWFGEHVLGWEMNPDRMLSGFDSRYEFARLIFISLLSLILATCWYFLDRRRFRAYEPLLGGLLTTVMRYHLAFTLILYGMVKVYPIQFGLLDLGRLSSTYGDSSPMTLLWTFMSYSTFYSCVTGIIEVTAAILLLFRRTTFLGAILATIAMVNVVVIDIGYDVTVKMFAIHLMLISILILLPQVPDLLRFILSKAPVASKGYPAIFTKPKGQRVGLIIKVALLLAMTITTTQYINQRREQQLSSFPYPSLQMQVTITDFQRNGEPLALPQLPWSKLSIGALGFRPDLLITETVQGQRAYHTLRVDTVSQSLSFYPMRGDSTQAYAFSYLEKGGQFLLDGTYKGDTLHIEGIPKRVEDYRLKNNELHWIQDF